MEAARLEWRSETDGAWCASLPDGRTLRVWCRNAGGSLSPKIRWDAGSNRHVPDVEYRARLSGGGRPEVDLGTYPSRASAQAQAGDWALAHLLPRGA